MAVISLSGAGARIPEPGDELQRLLGEHSLLQADYRELAAQHAELQAEHAKIQARHAKLITRFNQDDRRSQAMRSVALDLLGGNRERLRVLHQAKRSAQYQERKHQPASATLPA